MRALVQLRGEVNVSRDVRDTLEMLNIHSVNHCTFVPETDAYEGMITKVNDVVAHGQPSVETVALLLRRRGEPLADDADVGGAATAVGGVDGAATAASSERASGRVNDEWVAENTDYEDVDALAQALVDEETKLQDVGLAPTLRLHPPRGGHDGIKHPTKEGGQLGKHDGDAIDDLLEAMR
ncbi:MAG: 50S ribosomal protein L30 [Haloarculaceae archaeon]